MFLVISTSMCEKKLVFLLDTGSQISLIKAEKILDTKINTSQTIEIIGIADNKILRSLGIVKPFLNFSDRLLSNNFHVLHENMYLRPDGIIGADFLIKYSGIIDIPQKMLTLSQPESFSDQIEKEIKHLSSFRIKKSGDDKYLDEKQYESAVQNYIKYEKSRVNVINKSEKENSDKFYYDKLPESHFQGFEIQKTEKLSNNENSDFCLVQSPNFQPYEIKLNREIEFDDSPLTDPIERRDYLMQVLNLNGLNELQISEISEILLKYSSAFYIPNDILKPTQIYKHKIKLKPNVDTVCVKQYKIPFAQRDQARKIVLDWEKNGVIRKSTSRFNSPLLIVPKKPDSLGNKQYRAVIDFRAVNKVTIPQLYPLPLPDELFDMLHGSTIYTVLDVHAAYHQIELAEECRGITAFNALNHHYEFCMLPFGLQSSGIAWLHTIHRVLQKFLEKNEIFVYVDDICMWSTNTSSHTNLIKRVLAQLTKYNIKLKPEKCKFFQDNIQYLGYKISKKGLEIDQTKTKCIQNYPAPRNLKELQRFLGFVNFYRKYIYDFGKIASPLYKLCKKDTTYEWNESTQKAFDILRQKLMSPPVLAFPNFDLDFVVVSDSSDVAAAAILANKEGKNERPIQYFSRTFNDAQKKYSTVHKELLAAVWGITWFRNFLIGRPFYLIVDQKSLLYLIKGEYKNTRVHRWAIELMEYEFEIIHREGRLNYCADALSRIEIDNDQNEIENKSFKTICLVKTRSKTAEEIDRRKNLNDQNDKELTGNDKSKNQNNESISKNNFLINERRGFVFESKEFDQICFLLSGKNCRLLKQLQHKMKKQIKIDNVDNNEILKIDKIKSLILFPPLLSDAYNLSIADQTIKTFIAYLTQNLYENVAINFDIRDMTSYNVFKRLLRKWFSNTNISLTIYLNLIIQITDPIEINKILVEFHNTTHGGHAGWNRMYENIKKYFTWSNMISDIKSFVKNCDSCQRIKITRHTKQPIVISDTPSSSFANVAIDHVGRITTSDQGNSYILTAICVLTKYAIAIPVPDLTADITAKYLVERVFLTFGYPEILTSDNHQTFQGNLFKSICKFLKINRVFTSPYTPKSNTVERFHSTLHNS